MTVREDGIPEVMRGPNEEGMREALEQARRVPSDDRGVTPGSPCRQFPRTTTLSAGTRGAFYVGNHHDEDQYPREGRNRPARHGDVRPSTPTSPAASPTRPCFRKIADVAEKYKHKVLKLTGAQRIIIIGIREEDLDAAWNEFDNTAKAIGLTVR